MKNIKNFNNYNTSNNINVLDIIREFNMDEYLNIILTKNKSNNAPYHNINHLLCVTEFCYVIGKEEGVSKKDLKILTTAGLFHDFNHSEGKKKDDENIKQAKNAVIKYVKEEDIEDVNKLIDATQFPYVIEDKDLTKLQKIIRDADMMQTFQNNFIHQVIFGLSKELGKDPIEFLMDQKNFISNLKFYTKTAKKYTKEKLKDLKKDINYMIKISDKNE